MWPGHVQKCIKKASIRTAEFGKTEVQRKIRRLRPKPIAHGVYTNSWHISIGKDRVVLGNSAIQAYFVEVGRRPGRAPPFDPIHRWVIIKWKSLKRTFGPSRKPPGEQLKPKKPRAPRESSSGDDVGVPPDSNKPKNKRAPSKATLMAQKRAAQLIRMKIKHKGTKARYPLRSVIPSMRRFFKKDILATLNATRPPRK